MRVLCLLALILSGAPGVADEATRGSGFAVSADARIDGRMPPVPLPKNIEWDSLPFKTTTNQSEILIEGFDGRLSTKDPSAQSHSVEMLSQELARAVAQGLLDAPDPSEVPTDSPEPPSEGTLLSLDRSNLSITNAVDQLRRAPGSSPGATASGWICLPDKEFDILAWGDARNAKMLGPLRHMAFQEDGEPSSDGMLALARYYIAMGFGNEAKELLAFLPEGPRRAALGAMADIVDQGKTDSEILKEQIYCKGKVALWALLSRDRPAADKPADANQILSAFSELPLHLRIHLGPVLSQRLGAMGFEDEAQIALNAVTRGGGHTPAQDLTTARLGLAGTSAVKARDQLAGLSQGTDLIAAQALLELLLDAERRGVPPAPAWVDDAPSLVRATQGTETAAALNIAGLRGQIALGRFDALRAALNQESPGVDQAVRARLANAAIAHSSDISTDPEFLRGEIGFLKIANPMRIQESDRLRVAQRLIDLGLPDRALAYLSEQPDTKMAKLTTVQAHLRLGRHDAALEMLRSINGPEVDALRGQAFLRRGDFPGALVAFQKAEDTDQAQRAALRVADWAWIANHATPELAEAGETLRRSYEPKADQQGENTEILSWSQRRRSQAMALLNATRLSNAFTN